MRVAPAQTAPAANDASPPIGDGKKSKSIFAEDGPVDTTWTVKSSRSGTPWSACRSRRCSAPSSPFARVAAALPRQGPVIQTQIVLALVGAMVMMVVGASLARAFGIVGAARSHPLSRQSGRPEGCRRHALDACDRAGVGRRALFAALPRASSSPCSSSSSPSILTLTVVQPHDHHQDSTGLKDLIEGVFRRRRIPYELRSTATEEIGYEVKLPLDTHTDTISDALVSLKSAKSIDVKWEPKKDAK